MMANWSSPNDYAGQTVVVVGMSNSGCDTAIELLPCAKKVYLSHRSGARIVCESNSFLLAHLANQIILCQTDDTDGGQFAE